MPHVVHETSHLTHAFAHAVLGPRTPEGHNTGPTPAQRVVGETARSTRHCRYARLRQSQGDVQLVEHFRDRGIETVRERPRLGLSPEAAEPRSVLIRRSEPAPNTLL